MLFRCIPMIDNSLANWKFSAALLRTVWRLHHAKATFTPCWSCWQHVARPRNMLPGKMLPWYKRGFTEVHNWCFWLVWFQTSPAKRIEDRGHLAWLEGLPGHSIAVYWKCVRPRVLPIDSELNMRAHIAKSTQACLGYVVCSAINVTARFVCNLRHENPSRQH